MDLSPIWEQARDSSAYQSPRSRLSARVAVILPVVLSAAIIAAAAVIVLYSPLRAGDGTASGPTVTRADGTRPTYVVTYTPGTTFAYSFSIENRGRLGVTITGLDLDHRALGRFEIVGADGRPFSSFALPAGESRAVTVRVQMPGCPRPPSLTSGRHSWASEKITYSVLGVPHTRTLDLPMQMAVDVPTSITCL